MHSVIELARRMNLTTVAEGIETEGDQLCLNNRGCVLGQGYLYARPLPAVASSSTGYASAVSRIALPA